MKLTKFRSASLLVAGVALGGVTAGAIGGAFAADDGSSGSSPSSTSSSAPAKDGDGPRGDANGAKGGHTGEAALTGSNLAKATAAAKKAVSGGTVDRAETDSGDATYEVHMSKSDGTKVTVKLDKSFGVTAVEDGMGR